MIVVVVVVVVMVVVIMAVVVVIMAVVMVLVAMVLDGMAMSAMIVRMAFEQTRTPGDGKTEEERQRQSEPVMLVELEFGEQIRTGDADEGSRTEGQDPRRELWIVGHAFDEEERCHADRDHEGEERIDHERLAATAPTRTHQRRDRQGIERLVQDDAEEDTEPGEPFRGASHRHGGSQRDTGDQGVHAEAEEGAGPTEGVVGVPTGFSSLVIRFVVMETEEPFQHEEDEESGEEREEHAMRIGSTMQCMREHVQDRDAEQDTRDQGQGELGAAMPEPEEDGNNAPDQGDEDDEDAVDDQGAVHGTVAVNGGVSRPHGSTSETIHVHGGVTSVELECPITSGAVAQLGERLGRIEEVEGSIPFRSMSPATTPSIRPGSQHIRALRSVHPQWRARREPPAGKRYTSSMPTTRAPADAAGTPTPQDLQFDSPVWKTPAMQQFVRFKKAHPECVLLFRMGDFYELFGDDAILAHKALAITLTERTKGMPMAGVPHHALEGYLRRLVEQGHRVAICDQVQDPKDAKGVVERAVTRVLTPGTLVDETLLEDGTSNHVAAIRIDGDDAAIATAELSTGRFDLHETTLSCLVDDLIRIGPAEIVHAELDGLDPDWLVAIRNADIAPCSARPAWTFDVEEARHRLESFHGVSSLEGFGLAPEANSTAAAGALMRYLMETQSPDGDGRNANLGHLRPPRIATSSQHLMIDATSLRSLEVERTLRSGGTEGTLLSELQRSRTPMGRRLLREWLCWPLIDRNRIEARQRAIGALIEDPDCGDRLRDILSGIQDVARIGARVSMRRATPRDVVALGRSLGRLVELLSELEARPAFEEARNRLEQLGLALAGVEERVQETCVEDPPAHLRQGGLFKDGVDEILDEARLLQRDANSWLLDYQAKLTEEHAIASMKVGFNKVFGYYIEISNANRDKVPDSFTRKQTLKNAERYITPELKTFEEKVLSAESRAFDRERELFDELCTYISDHGPELAEYASIVAALDCLAGLAEIASAGGWCRPEMVEEPTIEIEGGRHPVLDRMLKDDFVPNDTHLGTEEHPATLGLITGPNMAGKSTYIRQVALITLLAHAGSWVPATTARIGLTDRIFTRIGASDELHSGRSTFMVEMTETANILHNATARSLVILDEIGRGTSTLDGLSLAWAIAETLAARGARTLFATHYHELTSLADRLDAVGNLHVTVREWNDRIIFLHRIQPGRTDRSYGIHVARLAGVDTSTLDRAQSILETLAVETGPLSVAKNTPTPTEQADQLSLFKEYVPHPVIDSLREMSIETMTPLEAFDRLRELLDQVRDSK